MTQRDEARESVVAQIKLAVASAEQSVRLAPDVNYRRELLRLWLHALRAVERAK